MRNADELMTAMRERGLRVTPQRMAIVAELAGNTEHPTVETLFDAARSEMPAISLKTVYQTVHDLEALGEVRLLDVGTGQVRVDPNVEHPHHHVVCGSCGRVRDVDIEFPDVTLPRRYRAGFHVDAVDVIFRGSCTACSGRARSARRSATPRSPARTVSEATRPVVRGRATNAAATHQSE